MCKSTKKSEDIKPLYNFENKIFVFALVVIPEIRSLGSAFVVLSLLQIPD